MPKQKKEPTNLNDYDRKVLDKYSVFYIDYIESTKEKTDNQKNPNYKSK
jgi:hypothetical protein